MRLLYTLGACAANLTAVKILLFGATGMVGQGVLRACLRDPVVTEIVSVGRARTGRSDAKLREALLPDLFAMDAVAPDLLACDACFFCLGVSSVGMNEADYTRVTHDLTLAIGERVADASLNATFIYVSGAGTGTDSRRMWARVKGRTEAALAALPLTTFAFRPGFIQPMYGAVSKTGWIRAIYAVIAPVSGLVGRLSSSAMTTTDAVGKAMLSVAADGYPSPILGNEDINRAAARRS